MAGGSVTTEYVLILGLYAFILLGTFLGERGPVSTFNSSGPRLAAKVEKNISVGKKFINATTNAPIVSWLNPEQPGGSQ